MSDKRRLFVIKPLCRLLLLCSGIVLGASPSQAQVKAFTVTEKEDALQTLGDMKPAYIDFSSKAVPSIPPDEVIRRYVALIKSANDPELRVKALHRLSNLEALFADQKPDGLVDDELWQIAIESYQEVIKLKPGRRDTDELLYQLAHAHEMKGELTQSLGHLEKLVSSYPQSRYFLEAQFRIAELQYGFGHYPEAERAYSLVLKKGQQTAYSSKAQYMLGWALYKQDKHEPALSQYMAVLDSFHSKPEQELSKVDHDLMEDALRIMSVIFSYRNGADSVAALLDRTDRHKYAQLLYSRLSDYYLSRQRYQDAADTAGTFMERYPKDAQAPLFAVRRIEAFQAGNFPGQVWPEKERFVESFGIYSEYWKQQTPDIRIKVEPHLKTYLDELARLHYVKAQGSKDPGQFRRSAQYFRHFVEAFPTDPTTSEKYFLQGEAYANALDYDEAVVAYEKAAYEFPAFKKRSEAAYAAIVAYDKLIQAAPESTQVDSRKRRVLSLIRFADEFPADKRTPQLLLLAGNEQFDFSQHKEALETTQRITKSDRKVSKDLMRGAWLTHGNAAYALGLFSEAEMSLNEALKLWEGEPDRRREVEEKLAASVYKQGEQLLAANHTIEAVDQLLRVGVVAPGSTLNSKARYDAAMKLMEAKQWSRAIEVLTGFRKEFPNHELASGITEKLVYAYDQNKQPALAARELQVIAKNDQDPERRRKALFQSAEMLEGAGKVEEALSAYREYARSYSKPVTQAAEVHRKLADIYGARQAFDERGKWLNGLIELDAKAGAERDDRTRYLAAEASWQLAQDQKARFDDIKLTLPLKQSLGQKRSAMQQVMDWLKRTNDYGVGEFATASTHLSGDVYRQLSKDLLASARPSNLDELELEQYNVLLEEQAFPFEERAIEFYELNTQRAKNGIYDKWVKESFSALSKMVPARYDKSEMRINVVSQLR